MNDQRSYGIMAPAASRLKLKDRELHYPAKWSNMAPLPPPHPEKLPRDVFTTMETSKASKGTEVVSSTKLLAGYMAYECLTKGTMLGQKFNGAAETAARGNSRAEAEDMKTLKENMTYKEIGSLLTMNNDGGVHIPGIVNPTQLARWIQM